MRLKQGLEAHQTTLHERAAEMAHLIDATIVSVRHIATALRPTMLDDFGLVAAIEWQAQDFQQRFGIACQVKTQLNELPLDKERATSVFRVFQEALTNVARHAEAAQVTVIIRTRAINSCCTCTIMVGGWPY